MHTVCAFIHAITSILILNSPKNLPFLIGENVRTDERCFFFHSLSQIVAILLYYMYFIIG